MDMGDVNLLDDAAPYGDTPTPSAGQQQRASSDAGAADDDGLQETSQRTAWRLATVLAGADIHHLLTKALGRLGCPDAADRACDYQARLASELHIHRAEQLFEMLAPGCASEGLAEVKHVLMSNLFRALQSECQLYLKSGDVPKMLPPRQVQLEITRCDVLQVSNIELKRQTFDMDLFVQATFVGGAKDEHLRRPSAAWPIDAWGRPTFRPSAEWYLAQVEFHGTSMLQTRTSSVVTAGDDLQLNKKVKGTIFEEFDGLGAFPFDSQKLSARFVVNCANEGKTPVVVVKSEKLKPFVVDQSQFSGRFAWLIGDTIELEMATVSAGGGGRRFPVAEISVSVYRRPHFFLINVALPSDIFALLAIFMMLLPVNYPPARLTYMLALTLTAVTYKLWTASFMPALTFLTLLDKFQLACAVIIISAVVETAALGSTATSPGAGTGAPTQMPDAADRVDFVCMCIGFGAWLLLNLWWLSVIVRSRMSRSKREAEAVARQTRKAEAASHRLQIEMGERNLFVYKRGSSGSDEKMADVSMRSTPSLSKRLTPASTTNEPGV